MHVQMLFSERQIQWPQNTFLNWKIDPIRENCNTSTISWKTTVHNLPQTSHMH